MIGDIMITNKIIFPLYCSECNDKTGCSRYYKDYRCYYLILIAMAKLERTKLRHWDVHFFCIKCQDRVSEDDYDYKDMNMFLGLKEQGLCEMCARGR